MSQASATLSHRRSEGPRRRSIVPVTLLIVLAIVAQACGSSDSSNTSPVGAQENVATSADWNFQLLTPDGMALPIWPADDGTEVNGYLIGKDNQLRATVPAEVLASATDIVVEERTPTGDWTDTGLTLRVVDASGTPMQLPVDASGTAEANFNGGGAFLGPHEFRLRAQAGSADAVVGYSNVVQATGFETEPVAVVAGAEGDAIGASWNFALYTSGYDPVEKVTRQDGTQVPELVYDKRYYMRATVPQEILVKLPRGTVVLQHRDTSGNWVSLPDKYVYQYDGTVEGWFPAPTIVGPSEMRLSEAVTGSFSSESLPFDVAIQYEIKVHNRMKEHLKVSVPTNYNATTGEYDQVSFDLDPGAVKTIRYINPPEGTAFGLEVENKDCSVLCKTHLMRPEQQDRNLANNCLNLPPNFLSGETYDVFLDNTNAFLDATFALGGITGKFEKGASISKTCLFSLRSNLADWQRNSPVWVKVGEAIVVLLAVVAVAALVVEIAVAVASALGYFAVESALVYGPMTYGESEALIILRSIGFVLPK